MSYQYNRDRIPMGRLEARYPIPPRRASPQGSNCSISRSESSTLREYSTSRSAPSHSTSVEGVSTASLLPQHLSSQESTHTKDKGPGAGNKWFVGLEETWWLEGSALLLSVASFGYLVYLLLRYDGSPLSKWTFSGLSPNTIVSILAGICRASLALAIGACLAQHKWNWFKKYDEPLLDFDRFEAASRGPWGSCRVLLSMIRHPHWVGIGAFTMLLLVGFEPFLQALISFDDTITNALPEAGPPGKSTSSPIGATIRKCSKLDSGSYRLVNGVLAPVDFLDLDGNGTTIEVRTHEGWVTRVDSGMTAAVWNGFSSVISTQNLWPLYSCGSGNCTWDMFASLSMCAECHDISQHLVRSSGQTDVPYLTYQGWEWNSEPAMVSNQGHMAHIKTRNRTLPYTRYEIPSSGLNISNFDGPPRCSVVDEACPDTNMTAKITPNPGQTIMFFDHKTMAMSIQIIEADSSWARNETVWEETPITATECALFFCVNAHKTTVEHGMLKESIVQTWRSKSEDSFSQPGKLFDGLKKYAKYMNYTLDYGIYDVERTDLELYVPEDEKGDLKGIRSETFNVTQGAVNTMIQVLAQGFGYPPHGTWGRVYDRNHVYPSLGWDEPPGFMTSLGTSGNVTASFQNVAASLTKWMRDRGQAVATGNARYTVVVIRVQWPYLIWPAIALFAAFIFIMLSIGETKRLGLPAWKTNMLAVLAHGPKGDLRDNLEDAAVKEKVYDFAKEAKVTWKFENSLGSIVTKTKS